MLRIDVPEFDKSVEQYRKGTKDYSQELVDKLRGVLINDADNSRYSMLDNIGAALAIAESYNYKCNDAGTFRQGSKGAKVKAIKKQLLADVFCRCVEIMANEEMPKPERYNAVEDYLLSLMPGGADTNPADYKRESIRTSYSFKPGPQVYKM